MKNLVLFFLCISMPTLAIAKNKNSTQVGKYFYTLPAEAGDEWAYQIPGCLVFSAADARFLKACEKYQKNQVCHSAQEVELKSGSSNLTKKFKLIYHFFSSKTKCEDDRAQALNGESEI